MNLRHVLSALALLAGCGDDAAGGTGGGAAASGSATGGPSAASSATGSPSGGGGDASAAGSGGDTASGTGEATSTGSGEGGGPQVVVTQCDEIDVVGTWQNVTPPEFLDPPNLETWGVAVNPLDGVLYAGAGNITNGCGGEGQPACFATGIYRSEDCGAHWELVSTGENGDQLHTGNPWAIIVDPTDSDVLFVNNGYGGDKTIFRSRNGGVDFEALDPDPEQSLASQRNFVQAMAMDPADPRHLIVSFHDDCTAPYNGNCLSVTHDGGDSWELINGPDELDAWAEAASVGILGPSSYLYTTPDGWGGFFTNDGGDTWTKVLEGPAYGSYGGGPILDPAGNAYVGIAGAGIFVSRPAAGEVGAQWTLLPGSPQASVVATDGVRLYVNYLWDGGDDPLPAAPLDQLGDEPAEWVNTNTAGMTGVNMLEFDASHGIMYAASPGSGVWRYATAVTP